MSFDSLSNEIIIEIIRFLPEIKDILSVGKTCHFLNELSTPYLYSSIGQGRVKWCSLFLRTISARPDLAALVEIYTGHEENYVERCKDDNTPLALINEDFPEQSVTAMKKVMREVSIDERAAYEWEGDFFSGLPSFDHLTAMIIALLPNLQELHMQNYGCSGYYHSSNVGEYPFIQRVLDYATDLQEDPSFLSDAPPPHSLSQLRVTSTQCWEYGIRLSSAHVESYMRIPSVRKFIGRQIYGYSQRPPSRSQVEEIDLINCEFKFESFTDILKNFPRLRKFSYDDGGTGVDNTETFSPSALRRALEACRKNLEEMYVYSRDVDYGYYDGEPPDPISFADFPKLRRIAATAYMLIGFEKADMGIDDTDTNDEGEVDTEAFLRRIPRGLKALELTDCDNRQVWTCVRELVRRKEEIAPDLKFVRLVYGYSEYTKADGFEIRTNGWQYKRICPDFKPVGLRKTLELKGTGVGWIEECKRAGVKLRLERGLESC
ncbi:hypothetical protein ACMFMG_005005 [Clarireedia jacksonii]